MLTKRVKCSSLIIKQIETLKQTIHVCFVTYEFCVCVSFSVILFVFARKQATKQTKENRTKIANDVKFI